MSVQSTQAECWRVQLYGRFTLSNPAGEIVRLPDRKTEGLLAVLALHRTEGISRQEAADILWPGRAPRNLANLRQALSVLRRELGPASIEGSTRHVALSDDFLLASDYDHPELRRANTFMVGHDGDWFDFVRFDDVAGVEAPETTATVVDQFADTLTWLSTYDPAGMYAMLQASPPMARSLPYARLASLLDQTRGIAHPAGWHAFWLGTVENDLEYCKRLLRQALREAKRTSDLALACEVISELGRVSSRTGDLDRAMRLCDLADEVAVRLKTPVARAHAVRLRATVLLQWHDPRAGHALLQTAADILTHPMEVATVRSQLAFYEASLGWYDRAEVSLAEAQKIGRSTGHFRIGIVGATTEGLLRAASGSRADGVRQLEKLSREFYAANASQFGVYAQELAAKVYVLEGDKQTGSELMRAARRARQGAQMYSTPLEAKRITILR